MKKIQKQPSEGHNNISNDKSSPFEENLTIEIQFEGPEPDVIDVEIGAPPSGHSFDSGVTSSVGVPTDHKDSSSRSNDPEKLNVGSVDTDESDRYLVNRSGKKTKENSHKNIKVLDVSAPEFEELIAWINSSSAGNDHPVSTATATDRNQSPGNVAQDDARCHSEKDAKGVEAVFPAGKSSQPDPSK